MSEATGRRGRHHPSLRVGVVGDIGDEGTVLTWSPFEETTLNQVVEDLEHWRRATA